MSSDSALDAYSQIVAGVAAGLTPRVASLRVPQEGSRGAQSQGSAVVFTPDGFLVTNAHVVGSSSRGTALFSDGTAVPFTVAGIGLGLAVPMNATSRRIIAALMRDGRVRRAYLGVVCVPAPVPPALRERVGRAEGLRVAEVVSSGPAARAGLRAGDLLLTAAGGPVASAQDLQRLMFGEAIGRPLAITVVRNGALVDVIAEPTELVA